MSVEIEALLSTLRRDEKVLRLRESFDSLSFYNLPIEQIKSEIETLHMMRPSRTLKPYGDNFIGRLIEANVSDQSTRSRLAEISLQAYRAEKSLATAVDAMRDYITVKYSASLSRYKTKEERMRIVSIALKVYLKYIDNAIAIQRMASIIIEDIDKGAWSLKLTVEALKSINQNEHTI